MKRAHLFVAATLLGCAPLVVWWWSAASGDVDAEERGSSSSGDPSATQHAADARTTLRQWWEEGIEYRYRLEQQTLVTVEGNETSLELRGEMYVSRLDRSLVRFRFVRSDVANASQPQAMTEALQEPFFSEILAGQQERIRLVPTVDEAAAQVWKAFLSTIHVEWPENASSHWRRVEAGPVGVCEMRYTSRDASQVSKTRLKCSAPEGVNVVELQEQTAHQDFYISGRRLERVNGDERIVTAPMQGIPSFTSTTSLTLQYLGARPVAGDVAAWRADAQRMRGSLFTLHAASNTDLRSTSELLARIGDRSFPSVIAKMLEIDAIAAQRPLTSEENAAFGRSFIALRSLLQLEPEHAADIEKHLLRGGPLTQHLVGVLGEAGTTEAQEVLARYIQNDEMSARDRTLAGIAMARLANPSVESIDVLDRMQQDPVLATQATYSLGSNAHRLMETNPQLAATVVERILEDLETAPIDDRARYLTALGNAGSTDSLPSLNELATSPVPKTRRGTALALRRIPGQEAERLLLHLLADRDPTVRAQAAGSIVSREPSDVLVGALGIFIVEERVYIPRAKAVEGATRWLRNAPALAQALRVVAAHDEAENLRLAASQALQRHGG